MAITIREGAFGCGTHVSEDERGGGFAGEALKVDAIPSRDRRSEYTRFWAERRRGVVAYAEAITIVGPAGVLGVIRVNSYVAPQGGGGEEMYSPGAIGNRRIG